MSTKSGDRLLCLKEVIALTTYQRASIYRKMQDGSFPKQVKIGARAVRWRESEIDAWVASHLRAAGDTPP